MNLVIIAGITGSGKTEKAFEIYNELKKQGKSSIIINCDSRQVYKDSFLSANIEKGEFKQYNEIFTPYFINDIPHFLINFINPAEQYSLSKFLIHCEFIIDSLPELDSIILVGGTGLWANAIYNNYKITLIKDENINEYNALKGSFQNKNLDQLTLQFSNLDQKSYQKMNESDQKNKVRLQNKILQYFCKKNKWNANKSFNFKFDKKTIIITDNNLSIEENKKILIKRLQNRIELGLFEELENLYIQLGHSRMKELGMFQAIYSDYKTGIINFEDLFDLFVTAELQYQKRQKTWINKYFKQ